MYEWMSQALCAQTDADLWFPDKGTTNANVKKICRTCPVLAECAVHTERIEAEAGTQYGAWAGKSRRDRTTPAGRTLSDRDRAVVRLTEEGLSATEISVRLGCTTRTVVRARTAYREQEAAA